MRGRFTFIIDKLLTSTPNLSFLPEPIILSIQSELFSKLAGLSLVSHHISFYDVSIGWSQVSLAVFRPYIKVNCSRTFQLSTG